MSGTIVFRLITKTVFTRIQVPIKAKMLQLKQLIEEKTQIPPKDQQLYADQKFLKKLSFPDDYLINKIGLREGDAIFLKNSDVKSEFSNPEKPKGRRSSLKTNDNTHKFLKFKEKRHSVSWGKSDTFQFKQMKATFQETKDVENQSKEKESKHKEFVENRRKSIKDEFSLVKEALKKKMIIEEDEEETNDELKRNTDKNVKMGHDALNEEEIESSSY